MFTATLESIFRRLNWENKGVKIDEEFLSNLRFTDDIFLCTETPQELQRCYNNYPMKVGEWVLRWTSQWQTNQHPNKREQCADRKCPRLRVLGTTLQPQGKEPGQRDTTKNRGRLGGICQTPGHLQKRPCHLPEETGVQLMCAASYDIWCRDLDTDQTSTEQTCSRTDQNGKKYAQNHRMLWHGPAKWKRRHYGRIGNIKEFQDYEHTMFFSLPHYWGVWLTVALSQ